MGCDEETAAGGCDQLGERAVVGLDDWDAVS